MTIALVLLPGLNNTQELYRNMISAFPDDITCITPDIPAIDSMPTLAKRLLEELPPKFYLAGLSFGGFLALEILKQAAHRVEGIILLATNAAADSGRAKKDGIQ